MEHLWNRLTSQNTPSDPAKGGPPVAVRPSNFGVVEPPAGRDWPGGDPTSPVGPHPMVKTLFRCSPRADCLFGSQNELFRDPESAV